jgi:hypothetical protein
MLRKHVPDTLGRACLDFSNHKIAIGKQPQFVGQRP